VPQKAKWGCPPSCCSNQKKEYEEMEEPIKKRMEEKKIQEIILVEEDVEPLDAFTFEADKPESGGPVPNINCYVTLDLIVLCLLCVMLAWKVEKGLGRRFKRGSVPIIGSLP